MSVKSILIHSIVEIVLFTFLKIKCLWFNNSRWRKFFCKNKLLPILRKKFT
jgi:hypothetical protein